VGVRWQVPVCVFDLVVVAVVDRSFFVFVGGDGVRADCIDLMVAVHLLYHHRLCRHGNLTMVLHPDDVVVVAAAAAADIADHAPNYYYHRQNY